MQIIITTLLVSIAIFLIASIIIESIEKIFEMKERFVDED